MLTARIQALLDEKVAGSPRARELLRELEGRRLRIVARYTPFEATLLAEGGHLRLLPGDPAPQADGAWPAPDVTLSGSPLALMSLQREDPTAVIRRGDVQLEGDAELGARFQELAQLLRPDFEEGLAKIIGDVPAHGISSMLHKAAQWGRDSLATQAGNVGEFLAHESRVLVPRAEARQFIDDVDALRERVDRLAARVTLLEAAAENPS